MLGFLFHVVGWRLLSMFTNLILIWDCVGMTGPSRIYRR